MTHTEDLKEYANALELDFIGFCSKDVFDGAPEEKRPDLYLKEVFSIISIGYKLNRSSVQNLHRSRSAYVLEYDCANRKLDQAPFLLVQPLWAGYADELIGNIKGGSIGCGKMVRVGGDSRRKGRGRRPSPSTGPVFCLNQLS